MAENIHVDTSSFTKFARDLRRAEPALAAELRLAVKAAGELVASDARSRASFSTRIPSTIKVRAAGSRVRVVAGMKAGPHGGEAAAFEHRGKDGTFRHPVFGNTSAWVEQQARPFLRPALWARREEAVKLMKEALRRTFRAVGFKG